MGDETKMSQEACSSGGNLRGFRIQKKPSLSHSNSNGSITYSESETEVPAGMPATSPTSTATSSTILPNSAKPLNNIPVYKQPEVLRERELQVRFLIKAFPSLPSFEVYEMLSNVNFDINMATQKLMEKSGTTGVVYDRDAAIAQTGTKMPPVFNRTPSAATQIANRMPTAPNQHRPIFKRSRAEGGPKAKRRRGHNEDYDSDDSGGNDYRDHRVFDSDEDSDVEISDDLTSDKRRVLEFMQTATPNELSLMATCSKKKVDAIIAVRPFTGWVDLVEKLQTNKNLNTDLLNYAQRVLMTRNNIKQLMKKCTNIANQLQYAVKSEPGIKVQPSVLTSSLKLTGYQMIGLNWLAVLHAQGLNGILADEMGLGKTIQVISFLAHLKQINAAKTTHLIIVPASTLENWQNEFVRWCPSLRVLLYYGSAEERRGYRIMFAEGRHKDFDVVLTTYAMVSTSPEERKMFRVTPMHYVVFDEAHMLKNMNTQRYETLVRIKASKRILLTGTPLQNNLLELMSLLIFVMPNIFSEKTEDLKSLFQKNNKKEKVVEEDVPTFEREQIEQAKRIMKPFVLRRLKCDVLQDLPKKSDLLLEIALSNKQQMYYTDLVKHFQEVGKQDDVSNYSGMTMMTDLRKLSNHPLLLRYHYKYSDLPVIAKRLAEEPRYKDTVERYIIDDLACMSDFEINTMTKEYPSLSGLGIPSNLILESGKFEFLDKKLAELKQGGHRVLIFSQYVIMLNVMEEYMRLRNHTYLRLDGSTAVTIRQQLIDQFSNDPSIFIFLLSTRAGGLGINLTAADTVIIHDIDFNPYNDKQAEDRCHRMGQSKPVTVYRLVSKGTIEEGMLAMAQEKLKLEKELTSDDFENPDIKSVVTLLSSALGIDSAKATNLVSPKKKL